MGLYICILEIVAKAAERYGSPWWLIPLFIGTLGCLAPDPWFVAVGFACTLAIIIWICVRMWSKRHSGGTQLFNRSAQPIASWPTSCGRCNYSFVDLLDHKESRFSSCPECGWDVPWAVIAEAHRQEQLERERTKPLHANVQPEYAQPMTAIAPHPIVFTPVILEKVWGGRALEKLGKTLPNSAAKYGESWELADMDTTSASGAGGGAVRSVIAAGPLMGKSIRDAIELWGDAMLPRALRTPTGGFPLLIKFLDARENLSVQVHPSPDFARANPNAHLKTECWCILAADPGASIYVGIRPGVSRERFEAAARAGSPEIVEMLNRVPVIPGTCHNLPSGTVHALGAGVLVAEVQTPSDTTFRLYDWGRVGRELHIEPALACSSFDPAPPSVTLIGSTSRIRTAYFELFSRTIASAAPLDDLQGHVVMVLSGAGAFTHSAGRVTLTLGQTALVPSKCEAGWRIEPAPGSPLTLLVARPLVQG